MMIQGFGSWFRSNLRKGFGPSLLVLGGSFLAGLGVGSGYWWMLVGWVPATIAGIVGIGADLELEYMAGKMDQLVDYKERLLSTQEQQERIHAQIERITQLQAEIQAAIAVEDKEAP